MAKLSDKILKNAQRLAGGKSDVISGLGSEEMQEMDAKAKEKAADVKDIKPGSDARSAKGDSKDADDGDQRVEGSETLEPAEKRINRLIGEKKSMAEKLASQGRELGELRGLKETQKRAAADNEAVAPKLEDFKDVNAWGKAFQEHTEKQTMTKVGQREAQQKAGFEIKGKWDRMAEKGKDVAKAAGLTHEEYLDRISSRDITIHRSAQKMLLDSDHGHKIALDIANDMEGFNKLAKDDEAGAGQIRYIARREAHYDGQAESGDRKTTKAANPERDLSRGTAKLEDDSKLSKSDGKPNMKAIQKLVKSRGRGF